MSHVIPMTATEWAAFVVVQGGQFSHLSLEERHKRLLERCLCSKGLALQDSCVRQAA